MAADWLHRLERREKNGLVLVLVAVVVLALDHLAARPLVARCADLERDLELAIKQRALQVAWLQAQPLVDREFSRVHDRLGAPMAPAAAIVEMRQELDDLARAANVVVISVKHREPRRLEFYDEFAVDGEFEADELGLMRLLHVLVTTPGTYRVTRLKMTPDATGRRIKGSLTITKVLMSPPLDAEGAEA